MPPSVVSSSSSSSAAANAANCSPSQSPRGRKLAIIPAVPNIDYTKFRPPSRPPQNGRSQSFPGLISTGPNTQHVAPPSPVTTDGGYSSSQQSPIRRSGSELQQQNRSSSVPPGNNNNNAASGGGGNAENEYDDGGDDNDNDSNKPTTSRNTWRNRKRRLRRNKARRAFNEARSASAEAAAMGLEGAVDPKFARAIASATEKSLVGVNEAMQRMTISEQQHKQQQQQYQQQQLQQQQQNYRDRSRSARGMPGRFGSHAGYQSHSSYHSRSRSASPMPLPARLECLKNRKEKKAATELKMAYVTVIPSQFASEINTIIRNAHPTSITEMQHLRRFVRPENIPASVSGWNAGRRSSTPGMSRSRARNWNPGSPSRDRSMSAGSPHQQQRRSKRGSNACRPLYVLLCYTSLMSLRELYELLSTHDIFKPNARHNLPVITPHPVPKNQPSSAEQAKLLSELYWPTVYRRGNPYGPHPNLVDKVEAVLMAPISEELNIEFPECKGISCAEYYMKLARLVADEGHANGLGHRSGCVVVDFTDESKPCGEIIAVASDGRNCGHPLAHAPMRAIQLVGRKRVQVAAKHEVHVQSFDMNTPHTDLEKKYFILNQTKKDGYLMHNLHVFVTQEPCIMCSMGLVHSRISNLIMGRQMKQTGGIHADLAAPANPNAATLMAGGRVTSRPPIAHPGLLANMAASASRSRSRASQYFDARETLSPTVSPHVSPTRSPGVSPIRPPSSLNGSLAPQTPGPASAPASPTSYDFAPEATIKSKLSQSVNPDNIVDNNSSIAHSTTTATALNTATMTPPIPMTPPPPMVGGGVTLPPATPSPPRPPAPGEIVLNARPAAAHPAAGTSPVRRDELDEVPLIGTPMAHSRSSNAEDPETLTVWDVEELRRGRSRIPAPHRPGAVKDGYSLFWRDRLNWKFLAFEWHDSQLTTIEQKWRDDVNDRVNI